MKSRNQISKEYVQELAKRVKLELSAEEVNRYQEDIQSFLASLTELETLNTEGIEPTYQITTLRNVYRQDCAQKNLLTKQVLQNAPQVKAGLFQVPRILDE